MHGVSGIKEELRARSSGGPPDFIPLKTVEYNINYINGTEYLTKTYGEGETHHNII